MKKFSKIKKIIFASLLLTMVLGMGILSAPSFVYAQDSPLIDIGNDQPPAGTSVGASVKKFLPLFLEIPIGIVVMFIAFFLGIIQLFVSFLPWWTAMQLKWILTMSIPLTRGGIVDRGWEFCRDFANMFFIIILLAIAYATMLKRESYAMKATLPTLIIIALLINFSQVVAGLIVDVAQIFMNFFIQKGAADAGNTIVGQNVFLRDILGVGVEGESFWKKMHTIFDAPIMDFIAWCLLIITKGIIGIVFYLVEFLILLLYGYILLLRIPIIWILVMLAPLAWAGRVLPATKNLWDMWWKNFLQWAFMGVPFLFFLYFAGYLMEVSGDISLFQSQLPPVEADTPVLSQWLNFMAKLFVALLTPLTAIIMLFIGLFMGFSLIGGAPGFVNKIMQAPVKAVGGAAGAAAKGYAGSKLAAWAMKEGSLAHKAIRGIEKAPIAGKLVGGPGALMAKVKAGEEKKAAQAKRESATRSDTDLDDRLEQLEGLRGGARDLLEIKAILELKQTRGTLSDKHAKFLPILKTRGLASPEFMKEVTANRVDWAGVENLTKIEIENRINQMNLPDTNPNKRWAIGDDVEIRERLARLDPEKLAKETQKEALKNPVVAKHMQASQFNYLGWRASPAKKEAVKFAHNQNYPGFNDPAFQNERTRRTNQFTTTSWQT